MGSLLSFTLAVWISVAQVDVKSRSLLSEWLSIFQDAIRWSHCTSLMNVSWQKIHNNTATMICTASGCTLTYMYKTRESLTQTNKVLTVKIFPSYPSKVNQLTVCLIIISVHNITFWFLCRVLSQNPEYKTYLGFLSTGVRGCQMFNDSMKCKYVHNIS
jgi:hypothetical protein